MGEDWNHHKITNGQSSRRLINSMARQAIIIASNGPLTNSLKFAEEDARRIARLLESPRCGFAVHAVEDPRARGQVMDEVASVLERCSRSDTVIVYFSGHGVIKRGNLFLLLRSSKDESFARTTLSARHLLDLLSECGARQKLFILDCCNAGTLASSTGLKGERVPAESLGIEPENHYVLMASGHLEPARELEELKGSFLTSHICSALEERFVEADEDGDRTLSLDDLTRWLERQAACHNVAHKDHSVPVPRIFGMGFGPFYLTWGPAEWVTHEIPTITWPDGTEMVILPVLHDAEHVFCMGRFPITNVQYRRFVDATGHREPVGAHLEQGEWRYNFEPWRDPRFSADDQPVVCVSYEDARAYRDWVSSLDFAVAASKSVEYGLPPPQLWDFGAFGKQYPSWDPNSYMSLARYHDDSDRPASKSDAFKRRNAFGLDDMMGSVWEWCGATSDDDLRWNLVELRGASFTTKLSETRPVLKAVEIEDGIRNRLSEIGFRISGIAPLDLLPLEVRHRAAAMPVMKFGTFRVPPPAE